MRRYLEQKLKLRQLQIIAAVHMQGSLVKAAQILHVSQPALTKTLREIEEIAGARLFERHARGLRPTQHGCVLAQAAIQILALTREAETALDRLDQEAAGTLVIGALPTAAAGILPEVLHRMRNAYPQFALRVVEGRMEDLRTRMTIGEVDLILGRLYPSVNDDDTLITDELYDDPMSLIVGSQHPLAGKSDLTQADLAPFELAPPTTSFLIQSDTRAFLDTLGLTAQGVIDTNSMTMLREFLLMRDLITVLPRLQVAGDLIRGTLRALSLRDRPCRMARPAGIVYRRDRALPPAGKILRQLIGEFARETVVAADL